MYFSSIQCRYYASEARGRNAIIIYYSLFISRENVLTVYQILLKLQLRYRQQKSTV